MSHKPKTYQELKKQWYKKLAKAGFEDIEYEDGSLKRPSQELGRNPSHDERKYAALSPDTQAELQATYRDSVEEYYRLAEHFATNHTAWKLPMDKAVWGLHAQGHSERTIPGLLFTKYPLLTRIKVQRIVKKYKNIMLGGL